MILVLFPVGYKKCLKPITLNPSAMARLQASFGIELLVSFKRGEKIQKIHTPTIVHLAGIYFQC